MSDTTTKYTFATPYTDGDSEEAKVATVILTIHVDDNMFEIDPHNGRNDFTFDPHDSQERYNLWLAVIESMKKATEFAIDTLGYNTVKTESDSMFTIDSVGTIADPGEILLNTYKSKIDPRSYNLIVKTLVCYHYGSRPRSEYETLFNHLHDNAILGQFFEVPKDDFQTTIGLGRNTLKHVKNIFEEHGKTFK